MSDLRAASATGKAACVPFRPWKGGSDLRAVGSPLRKGGSPRLAKPCKSLPPPAFASCREMGGRMRVRPTESHANPVAPCQWEHERIDYNPKHALIPPVKGGNDSVLGLSLIHIYGRVSLRFIARGHGAGRCFGSARPFPYQNARCGRNDYGCPPKGTDVITDAKARERGTHVVQERFGSLR